MSRLRDESQSSLQCFLYLVVFVLILSLHSQFYDQSCIEASRSEALTMDFYDDTDQKKYEMSWKRFQDLNERLISHVYPVEGCPKMCGCSEHKHDCPQRYWLEDVNASADALLTSEAVKEFEIFLKGNHDRSQEICRQAVDGDITPTGGFCLLNSLPDPTTIMLPSGNYVQVKVPGLAPASPRIVSELIEFFKSEKASSLSDFGAGVGQYASEIVQRLAPDFQYNPYDGAGNIEEFTSSYVRYADLSAPLDVPKTDWVMSLDVGQHIPARFEGMFVRNLHRHNCQGIILNWAVLGQGGFHHVNEHSNDYIVGVFSQLGYEHDEFWEKRLREESDNHPWFWASSFVFRRKMPVC
jgi:hypothetical protein